MLIAYDGERPIGSVGYARLSETACEVQKFFVLEDARGKGAGGLLLDDLLRMQHLLFQFRMVRREAAGAGARGRVGVAN